MAINEFFFPDTINVKKYTDMIRSNGVDVCRKQIDKKWINDTLSKFSFGIANFIDKAQIGQSKKNKTQKQLKGFILCRYDIGNPNAIWIDLVCASVSSRVGLTLMRQAEEHIRSNAAIRLIMLYALHDENLKQWYIKQGFCETSVDIWDGIPKAYLMMKFL